jgi:PadR family transcriptional regulator, regulatory protein AphA
VKPTQALTPTARAILGFLSFQPRSGYEIRAAAQRSAGLIWGVNDGQLYPQLHDLNERGLIQPAGEPEGPKSRQRWRLTDAGRSALHEWLGEPATTTVLRDEGLMKLLFVDQVGLGVARDLIEQRRLGLLALQQLLGGLVPGAERGGPDTETGLVGPGLVHSFGIDFVAMSIAWCDQALLQISDPDQAATESSEEGERP